MRVAIAVHDLTSGLAHSDNPGLRVAAASVVKVDILAALLLAAQDARRVLTPHQRELANAMICESDNEAATELWHPPLLATAGARLGLHDTSYDEDNGWGASTTTVGDRLQLLRTLTTRGILTPTHRHFALDLMAKVRPDQRWGISALARTGDAVALKNGWLPRERDDGTWTVNSMGRITGPGRDLLIAVLSQGHDTLDQGIRAVERTLALLEHPGVRNP